MRSNRTAMRPRQQFLDETTFSSTLKAFERDYELLREKLVEHAEQPRKKAGALRTWANRTWSTFQLRFTIGDSLDELSQYLTNVVEAFERYLDALESVDEEEYDPPFLLDHIIDNYVDYLNMISAAFLLHREDLVPRIAALNLDTEYDRSDAIIESLLSFCLTDRPTLDSIYWKEYKPLLATINKKTQQERAASMEKYVKGWYKSMKGSAHFWGKHEQIEPDYSPYDGYWAICAAAFTYLYDIDDNKYREEMVYPKDMVDYARSKPRQPVKLEGGSEIFRVLGGQACPLEGQWFSPAKPDSARHFKQGEAMPVFDSEYGLTIWQMKNPVDDSE